MHTGDVVKRQINKHLHSRAHWDPQIYFCDHSQRLQVKVNAHPKEFIDVKLHQTVFLAGLDKYIGIHVDCTAQKGFRLRP